MGRVSNKEIVDDEPKKRRSSTKKDTVNNEIFYNRKISQKKTYISFNTRFVISLFIFAILLSVSFLLIMMSISKINEQTVDYQESSSVNYKVYLKDNAFYDSKYLESGNNNIYISPLIKKIEATFNYNFDISEKSNVDFTYYIVGKLSIMDSNEAKEFYSKEYILTDEKHKVITNSKTANITETININYEYYNDLANQFRQNYGINTKSYFEVSIKISGLDVDGIINLDSDYTRSIKIPLAEREVDIKVDDNKISNIHKTISKNKLQVSNSLYITIGIVSFVVATLCLIKIVRMIVTVLVPKKSKYDRYVNRILREYDRLIVNTLTAPDLNDMKLVKLEKFTELLDVRDNLKLPIKYYVVTEHQKCVFYLTHNNEIYVLTIKAVDLENN